MNWEISALALALALLAGLLAARRSASETERETAEMFQSALERIERGETGVRLEPMAWGTSARLVSAFNALVTEREGGTAGKIAVPDNHAAFRRLRDQLGIRHREDECRTFVGVVEIDRFATLRRSIGFQLANRVLQHVSGEVVATLDRCEIGRTNRTTIEFAFKAADADAAQAALERLSSKLEKRIEIDGFTFDLPVTIGFADASAASLRDELVDQAAAAVAIAQSGHKRVQFADQSVGVDQSFDDLSLMRDLPRAMREGELQLHYQPKLRSRTNEIDSAEALLRWWHPVRGQVATDRLIELAEGTGAIRDLSEWVLERAVTDQLRLAAGGHDISIYVNISGVLLPDPEFARQALASVARAPGKIGFEITETAVIEDPDGALANLRAFTEAGIKIAIDDYGSGLSSLAYLKQLPANELKIDRMFVSGLIDSHRDPLLVRSSIDLAHALEMEVTAEGVDDAIAHSLLRVMGCDMIQGYLISPPLAFDAFVAFLANTEALESVTAPGGSLAAQWRIDAAATQGKANRS